MIVAFLISLAVIVGIVVIVATMPNTSRCNGNCNQGRTCDCGDK